MTFKYDGSLGLSKINCTSIYICPVSRPTSTFHILFFSLEVLTTSMANPC